MLGILLAPSCALHDWLQVTSAYDALANIQDSCTQPNSLEAHQGYRRLPGYPDVTSLAGRVQLDCDRHGPQLKSWLRLSGLAEQSAGSECGSCLSQVVWVLQDTIVRIANKIISPGLPPDL